MIQEPCVDECFGCNRQRVGPAPGPAVCTSYAYPEAQWKNNRRCPLASHLHKQEKKEGFVDPLKRSKKSMKGKK